jgi:hypothetical protein
MIDEQPYTEPDSWPAPEAERSHFNGFWPVLLIGISVIIVFSWQIWVGLDTRQTQQQMQQQQGKVVDQSKQVQANLEKLVRGLVDLSKTDDEARRLVTKFAIKINDSSVPTATPAP